MIDRPRYERPSPYVPMYARNQHVRALGGSFPLRMGFASQMKSVAETIRFEAQDSRGRRTDMLKSRLIRLG